MRAAVITLQSKSSKMLIEAMKKYFDYVEDINIKEVEVKLESKEMEVWHKGKKIEKYDCLIVKGSYKYAPTAATIVSALSSKSYIPVSTETILEGHDKFLTQLKLQAHKVPMPTAYLAPTTSAAKSLLEKVNYPIVIKLPTGTQGKGVMFADSFASATSLLDVLSVLKQSFVVQEYIETGGEDIRCIVVGNKVVAAMKRVAEIGEKRSNIHAGGKGIPAVITEKIKRIAIQAAEAMKADIIGVDILEGPLGPQVIEVNVSPGLQGITEATKIDVADQMAKFLHMKTEEWMTSGKSSSTKKIMSDLGLQEMTEKQEVFGYLDFRGNRILLPAVVTSVTKFDDRTECVFKAERGKVTVTEVK